MIQKDDVVLVYKCLKKKQIIYTELDLKKMTNTIPNDVRIYLINGSTHKENLYTLKNCSEFDFKKILDILNLIKELKVTNPEYFI